MRVIGCLSGTSYDGIDVAAADLSFERESVVLHPLGALDVPFSDDLRAGIAAILPPNSSDVEQLCRLDTRLGQLFAKACVRGRDELCGGRTDLVVSHGQTVFHWVEGAHALGTLQLGAPAWIARATGVPVVSDLRSADVAAGGHGAPLAALFDALLLGGADGVRGALNLGGIANITVVGNDVLAYDIGPAGALIDAYMRHATAGAEAVDRGGARAARGTIVQPLLDDLLAEPYYRLDPPKSTGKELFHLGYLRDRLGAYPDRTVDGVLATLTELTAQLVADSCARHGIEELIASGGGTANTRLMHRIAALTTARVRTIDELGVPTSAKEAYLFAFLGFLTAHGLPGTLPACTGAGEPVVLGSITPGSEPLHLSAPVGRMPSALRIARP
ncbi:MAG: anhydro-N-acetylmuramic acid kinase [Streptosporangiales bacterium]